MFSKTFLCVLSSVHFGLCWADPQSSFHLQGDQPVPSNIFNYSVASASSQLRNDAKIVIDQFASVLSNISTSASSQEKSTEQTLFKSLVHGAMSYQLFQNITNSTEFTENKLDSMSKAINDTLNSINDVTDQLLSSTNGALKFADLRNCLMGLVQQGGLKDGESCVVQGLSITGVSEILTSVLQNFGGGIIPDNIIQLATEALSPTFTPLIPGEEQLYSAIDDAILSVQHAIAGELVQALDDALRCFKSTVTMPLSYEERLRATQTCNRDSVANHSSVLRDLKTLYLSIVNQFVGYVTPNVLEGIHRIANAYLDKGFQQKPEDKFFRNAISNSVKSIIASNSGNEVTYAYKIADCLDTVVGVMDPNTAFNKAATARCLERPDGPVASLRQIVYGYIQQIYGVLPVEIAAEVEQLGMMNLDKSSADYGQKVEELHKKFLKTNPGPEYVSCYERFTDCLFNPQVGGILALSSNKTQMICLLGQACQRTPDGTTIPFIRPKLNSQ